MPGNVKAHFEGENFADEIVFVFYHMKEKIQALSVRNGRIREDRRQGYGEGGRK